MKADDKALPINHIDIGYSLNCLKPSHKLTSFKITNCFEITYFKKTTISRLDILDVGKAILMRKVVLWCLFLSITNEKIQNLTFQLKS